MLVYSGKMDDSWLLIKTKSPFWRLVKKVSDLLIESRLKKGPLSLVRAGGFGCMDVL